jgi:hypothetical protein
MTLDSSGNLGIGTTSPTAKLTVSGGAVMSRFQTGSATDGRIEFAYNTTDIGYINMASASLLDITARSGVSLALGAGGSERMRITNAGDVGIGSTAPGEALEISRTADPKIRFLDVGNIDAKIGIVGSTALGFEVNGSERARIDSSGNLMVGTTGITISGYAASKTQVNTGGNSQGIVLDNINGAGGFVGVITRPNSTTTYDAARFLNSSSSLVGSISSSTTATTYATSSDYRLKNTIAPMTGALAKVALLKPCTYKWNADGSDGEGFIAHELAEVVPQCVTGEKDAVDAEGKPQYQGIDTSFLVATLTAALQELNAKFDAYVATHP